jgi:hypothetical protein
LHAVQLRPEQAAGMLLDRRNCRKDLELFASRVPVPGSPLIDADEDAPIPLIETQQAKHHKLILREMQTCMSTAHGRLMICAPPGSAKSTYASVVAPTWFLGTQSQRRLILASYGDDLARRHGRRTRQLLRSPEAMGILQCTLEAESRAADEFGLTNGSEYIACGIMGGVTGNRAHGIVIDDPVKGREQADSQVIRDRTFEAYQDDLLTRLIPGGWVVVINTRWHEDDLSGRILPEGWAGQSGDIKCRDGNIWRVLCLQAECETPSDPLKRATGEMLWPEWFDNRHWNQYRLNRRTWSSLYQQRPAPDQGILFRKEDMATYDKEPEGLYIIGASDHAVTPDEGDWTEHGIAGVSVDGSIYLLDWWRGRTGPEEWIERQIDMVVKHRPLAWFGEVGPIRTGNRRPDSPAHDRPTCAMPRRVASPHWRQGDKGAVDHRDRWNGAPDVAACCMGSELQRQCLVFPAGSPDDGVDTLGMLGRGADTIGRRQPRKPVDADEHAAAGGWMS